MDNAMEIARYIVTYCDKAGKAVSNLKLQKMLYFVWIDYYRATKTPLFNENFYAWQYGPVIPEVYCEFSTFAGIPINRQYETQIDHTIDITLLNTCIDSYIDFTAAELVEKSHREDGPWKRVYCNGEGSRKQIPTESIIALECE